MGAIKGSISTWNLKEVVTPAVDVGNAAALEITPYLMKEFMGSLMGS
jgi:hypothetical protein